MINRNKIGCIYNFFWLFDIGIGIYVPINDLLLFTMKLLGRYVIAYSINSYLLEFLILFENFIFNKI